MATLEKLRKRAGVIVAIVIGLALLAFVMGDLFRSNKPGYSRKDLEIAKIDGKSVSVQEYFDYVNQWEDFYRFRFGELTQEMIENSNNQAWNMLLQNHMMTDEYKKIGLAVSAHELWDIAQGANPHPIVREIFTNKNTGEFNRVAFSQFIQNIEDNTSEEERKYWFFLENQILQDRIMTKYGNLVGKGIYVTDLEAKEEYSKSNKRVSFKYIVESYTSAIDSNIEISAEDIEAYYEKYKNLYEQAESRDLEYVIFNIIPSAKDNEEIQSWITKIKDEFANIDTGDVIDFVNGQSDEKYIARNYSDGQLPEIINDFMFNAEIGEVYGPYFENELYKLAKLINIVYLPDSVRARHILLGYEQFTSLEEMELMADSIKTMIENGSNFETLAMMYSADPTTRDEGGDLGWVKEGLKAKPFDEACFKGEIGVIQIFQTQAGMHILEVLNKGSDVKKVNVAILTRKVEYSNHTYQKIYSTAIQFAGENNTYEKFTKAAQEKNYNKRVATNLSPVGSEIPGIETPRPLIMWAFEAEKNEVSEVFDFNDKFVVAVVTEIREKGIPPLKQVKDLIKPEVQKEKITEYLIAKMKDVKSGANSIEAVAEKTGNTIQYANNVIITSSYSAGIEEKVVAAAIACEKGILSDPIAGENGVYIIQVIDKQSTEKQDFRYEKMMLNNYNLMKVNNNVWPALEKSANIEDKRIKFY